MFTITCSFPSDHAAQQAAQRLRKRGFTVGQKQSVSPVEDPLLVAYPFGAPGGNSAGNNLMAALPPLSGNGVRIHTRAENRNNTISVLTDDTQRAEAVGLLKSLGGHIL